MTRVYVPSRGRAGGSSTLRTLSEEGVRDVWMMTPPEETRRYEAEYDRPALAQPGKGIGDARQAILTHAREEGLERYWMLDDDITGTFYRRGATRLVRESLVVVLSKMEHAIDGSGVQRVAAFGPEFRHRAWSGPPTVWDVNLRNFVCVNTAAPANYLPILKEDLDFALQVINAGWHTLRFNAFAFDSPRMGTTEGGCFDDYAAGLLDDSSKVLAERWPGIISLGLNADGYVESRVDWKALRSRTIKDIPRSAQGLYKSADKV